MLSFFRRYQKYIYIAITAIVIISFSFFGTYEALMTPAPSEPDAFRAVDGTRVKQSQVENMSLFLATSEDEKIFFRGAWGPNFLNDGVIRNDFFKTGLAQILMNSYLPEIGEDLQRKLQKEKRYRTYVHPQAQFISAGQVWKNMVPQLHEQFRSLRAQERGDSPEAIDARIHLFLAEKEFPAAALRHVLLYQEQQYSWIPHDPELDRTDLCLFGYHTVEDWFGGPFLRLISEFIINAAKIAEERGYRVTKEEAQAELIARSQASFQEVRKIANPGVTSPQEYMAEQLRRMEMTHAQAVEIWRQVLLFRRLFHDFGNATFLDTLPFGQYHEYAKEYAGLDLYSLPLPLRFSDFRSLQKFEVYLESVADMTMDARKALHLPENFHPPHQVIEKHPELVRHPYVLDVVSVNKHALASQIPLRETWEWELDEKNWPKILEKVPELSVYQPKSRSERAKALDSLDRKERARLDIYARNEMVEERSDWVEEAFRKNESQKMTIGLRKKGGKLPLRGLEGRPEERERLWHLLSQAPLADQGELTEEQKKADQQLHRFTADGKNVYQIRVLERGAAPEILTFAEAEEDGTLDELVVEKLEKFYRETREKKPGNYQKVDGSWKEVHDVRDHLAAEYLQDVLHSIKEKAAEEQVLSHDETASYRFMHHLKNAQKQLRKNGDQEGVLFYTTNHVSARDLGKQWLLEKTPTKVDRTGTSPVDWKEAFDLPVGEWSDVQTPRSGHAHFYHLRERGVADPQASVWERTKMAYQSLSADAQQTLMRNLLDELKSKNAISLDYLRRSSERSYLEGPDSEAA